MNLWMINHAVCYVVHVYCLILYCIHLYYVPYFVARRNEILLGNLIVVTVQHGDVPEPQNHDNFFLSIRTPL